MVRLSSCAVCSIFERFQLSTVGTVCLVLGGLLAAFSLFVWPLMFVWPLLLVLGFGMAIGHGACKECHIA